MNKNPTATISIRGGGEIVLELCQEAAPNTVASFVELAESGFYDGLCFHRVIKGFMIQGGCPDGNGTGGPGFGIRGEFEANGHKNPLKHERGVISMARSRHPDSAGSQFFLMHADAPHLDGSYAAFGRTVSGLDVIDGIACIKTGSGDKPSEPQVIESIKINRGDAEIGKAVRD